MTRSRVGAPVVVKFGGELLEEPQRLADLAQAISRVRRSKPLVPLVLVHGGGREIDAALARVGIAKQQVDGLRITDAATLDTVISVLAGLVNTRFVAALGAAGVQAVGLTGADGGIGRVRRAAPHHASTGGTVDLGLVGEPIGKETPELLVDLCQGGYVPVVCSIGASRDGRLFNVNADTLAAHFAARLSSPRLIIAGATAGVFDADGATIPVMSLEDIAGLIADGGATAGMIAKLTACRAALEGGAREVFIADGRDLAGLTVLVRHGLKAGAGKSTRISNGNPAKRRHFTQTAAKRRGA
jgi:acetylglutamate kinase